MNSATISADIISFTSLNEIDKRNIEKRMKQLLLDLSEKYKENSFLGRNIQGDSIECAISSPKNILRIALLLKTYIKTITLSDTYLKNNRVKYFKEHGIRMAIAVAPLINLDVKNGIIDGDAIYLSGRGINSYSTSNKKKIVIKNTMFFYHVDKIEQEKYDSIVSLLDIVISRCSAKQCEVIYHKLLGFSEKQISKKLNKFQSTISQHSTAAGWQSIDKVLNYFENSIS